MNPLSVIIRFFTDKHTCMSCSSPSGNWKWKRQQNRGSLRDLPSRAGHRSQLFIDVRLLVEKCEPIFPQHNSKASRTSHMEPVCAKRNKHQLCLYPAASTYTNSVQTYKRLLLFLPWIKIPQDPEDLGKQPVRVSVSCRFAVDWHFEKKKKKNLPTLPSAKCRAAPVKSLQVFSKDQWENLSVSVRNLPESTMEMSWDPVISYFHVSINVVWQRTNKLSHHHTHICPTHSFSQMFSLSVLPTSWSTCCESDEVVCLRGNRNETWRLKQKHSWCYRLFSSEASRRLIMFRSKTPPLQII